MRTLPLRLGVTLLALTFGGSGAMAQVTVDPNALTPLNPQTTTKPPPKPAPPKPAPRPAPAPARPVVRPATPSTKPPPASDTTVRTTPGGAPSGPLGNLPPVPTNPPPSLDLPPPIAVPTRPAPAPTAPPIAADAPGQATPIAGGVRVGFGAGRADLNPQTEASVAALVHGGPGVAPAAENASFTVTSYAAGTPEDPSTARRLSLSRAVAVRSVLIAQGIASVRIFVRALGPASQGFGDGPPDRTDVVVGPPVMPSPASSPASKP